MKNLVILALCSLTFYCCTNSVVDEARPFYVEKNEYHVSGENKVQYSDVIALSKGLIIGKDSTAKVTPKIECITNNTKDTVLYVSINPDGGWMIFSSDTRVPPFVAQCDSGSFEKLMKVDGAKLWIQSMAEEMTVIRSLPDEELNFSEKEIASNKAFWESISSPDKFVRENLSQMTRITDLDVPLVMGHYEYRCSTVDRDVIDSISRMITTDWHQRSPYNIYCPYKSDYSGRAPAGCVAIAGAQMLYYLHNRYGVPATAPSEAYCDGDVNSYTMDQTNYTTDIWDYMAYDGYYAAPLIANVGKRVNMDYKDDGSGAYTRDLVNNVFEPYGISCTYTNYNTTLLKNNLIDSIPVIIGAYSQENPNTGILSSSHAFIADRYKYTHNVIKNYYIWVYGDYPPHTPVPYVPEKVTYSYSSPNIYMIGFNWGWGSYYNIPSEWYTLTGDWISSRVSMSNYNWNTNRKMIYDFQVISN